MLYLESPPQVTSLSTKFVHERGGVPQLDKYHNLEAVTWEQGVEGLAASPTLVRFIISPMEFHEMK